MFISPSVLLIFEMYKSYRANVRAKISSIEYNMICKNLEMGIGNSEKLENEKKEYKNKISKYMTLTKKYTEELNKYI